jgi:hypothetical protein
MWLILKPAFSKFCSASACVQSRTRYQMNRYLPSFRSVIPNSWVGEKHTYLFGKRSGLRNEQIRNGGPITNRNKTYSLLQNVENPFEAHCTSNATDNDSFLLAGKAARISRFLLAWRLRMHGSIFNFPPPFFMVLTGTFRLPFSFAELSCATAAV